MVPDVFNNKKIIVGITGGIAAYKSCLLIRQLVSRGAEVKVIMTPSALEFITPLTLSTLSNNDVIVNTFPPSQKDGTKLSTWHIDYGMWADLMIIAPATINTIAKIGFGFADNALTTVVSALRAPLLIAPAADMDMYNNPANIKNIYTLKERGAFIVEAEEGFLASGLSGPGRMADVDKIVDAAELIISGGKKDLTEKNILITAGPTFEDIDPVRFIGNRSSGKMGYAIAKAAYLRGANVTLVSGPVALKGYPEIKTIHIRSAEEMHKAVTMELNGKDALIMPAAVADYKPAEFSQQKIKKEDGKKSIELEKTIDILASITNSKTKIVGFALETENEISNAEKKLRSKKMDLIVLNSLQEKGAGFEVDSNKVTIMNAAGNKINFPLATKFQTANIILNELVKLL